MADFEGHRMAPDMFRHLIGRSLGVRNMTYTWRDVSLYALGIGAHAEDLPYFYEQGKDGLKAFPTFSMLPYLNNITMNVVTPVPDGTNEILRDELERVLGYMPKGLHMSMDLKIHGRVEPYGGTLVVQDRLNNVYDRGEGRGIVADCMMEVYNAAGRHISTLHSYHLSQAFGGFGGPPFVSEKVIYPKREPDFETTEHMAENLACIYRLCGDTYKYHVDPEAAQSFNIEKPFMMGLCTYGFAVRMAVQQVFPYEPERITHISAQIRNLCFPGRDVTLRTWKMGDGQLMFRLLGEDGEILLNNGVIDYSADNQKG